MANETDTTSEVARVLREHFDPTGTERHDPYAAAVYEEAAATLAEAGLLRPQIATQEPAGATQGGSGDSRVSGGLDGAPATESPFRMPEDRWPFRPGMVVRDQNGAEAEWLDDAPQKTVLVDSQGTEWVRLGDGWFTPGSPSRWVSLNLEQTYGPLSVVSVGKAAP